MSAVDEYRAMAPEFAEVESPAAYVMNLADAAIAEMEAENKQLRRDDEMLRRALANRGSWEIDDLLERYPVTKRGGGEG